MARFSTIKDATYAWVETFNAIPMGVIEKIMTPDEWGDSWEELSPVSRGDRVSIAGGEHYGDEGEVVAVSPEDSDIIIIRLDSTGETVEAERSELDIVDVDIFPMWGTMWAFKDPVDNWWLEELGGLQLMADCGFRIYRQEDYDYIFGIDGAGYDFYEAHWIPLYLARGLKWADEQYREVQE